MQDFCSTQKGLCDEGKPDNLQLTRIHIILITLEVNVHSSCQEVVMVAFWLDWVKGSDGK